LSYNIVPNTGNVKHTTASYFQGYLTFVVKIMSSFNSTRRSW